MRDKKRKSIIIFLFLSALSLLMPVSMVIAGTWQTTDDDSCCNEGWYKNKAKQTRKAQPKFDVSKVDLGGGGSGIGGVKIGMRSFNQSDSIFISAFNRSEVDQPPRVIRAFPLQYPYLAKRDNINGRLVLKFVVDVDGTAKELEVVSARPPEVLEIFQDAALKAVARYKFKPAVRNGKDVLCIVQLPIVFEMDRKLSILSLRH